MTIKKSWDGNERPYYHFTTLDTFCKIVDSGKIRLSSCNTAKNAAVEVMALYYAIKNMLNNDLKLRASLLERNSLTEEEWLDRFIEYRMKSYMVCFSKFNEQNESEEISKAEYLWKFYADNSNGVVIKFNYECYPYRNHSSRGRVGQDSSTVRSTEIRMDSVIYEDEERLKKFIDMVDGSFHPFVTDIYKPKCCELENEIRMLVYLSNAQDLDTLKGISESSTSNSDLPEYLYYDFRSMETSKTGSSIQKVFCRNKKTRDKLSEICEEDKIELLDAKVRE